MSPVALVHSIRNRSYAGVDFVLVPLLVIITIIVIDCPHASNYPRSMRHAMLVRQVLAPLDLVTGSLGSVCCRRGIWSLACTHVPSPFKSPPVSLTGGPLLTWPVN